MSDPRIPDNETEAPGRFDEPVDPNNTEAPDLSPAEQGGFDPGAGDAVDQAAPEQAKPRLNNGVIGAHQTREDDA